MQDEDSVRQMKAEIEALHRSADESSKALSLGKALYDKTIKEFKELDEYPFRKKHYFPSRVWCKLFV